VHDDICHIAQEEDCGFMPFIQNLPVGDYGYLIPDAISGRGREASGLQHPLN
jgi:hypothetical protein